MRFKGNMEVLGISYSREESVFDTRRNECIYE